MNTDEMQYITEVLKCGSISKAARKLYMSQPLLSQKIHNVERELNIEIFNRHTYPISLTYAGEKIVESFKEILNIKNNLFLEIDEINHETRGKLRIALASHRATTLLPKVLPRFIHVWPLIKIEVIEDSNGTVSESLMNGKADLALFRIMHKSDQLEYVHLCRDNIILFAGEGTNIAQKFSKGSTIDLREVQNEKFVSVYEGNGFRKSQQILFDNYEIKPQIVLETHSIELACRLALSCDYVALYSGNLVTDNEIMKDNPYYCYIEEKPHPCDFCVCYRKDVFLTKYMKSFIEMTVEIYNNT